MYLKLTNLTKTYKEKNAVKNKLLFTAFLICNNRFIYF